MKTLKKDIRSWIVMGMTFLTTVFTGGILYAAIGFKWDTSEIHPRNVALLYCVKN